MHTVGNQPWPYFQHGIRERSVEVSEGMIYNMIYITWSTSKFNRNQREWF